MTFITSLEYLVDHIKGNILKNLMSKIFCKRAILILFMPFSCNRLILLHSLCIVSQSCSSNQYAINYLIGCLCIIKLIAPQLICFLFPIFKRNLSIASNSNANTALGLLMYYDVFLCCSHDV